MKMHDVQAGVGFGVCIALALVLLPIAMFIAFTRTLLENTSADEV